jgi:hypothetical protein
MPEKTYQAFYKSRSGGWTAWVREFTDKSASGELTPHKVEAEYPERANAMLRSELPEIARATGGLPDPLPPVESVEDPHTHFEDIVIKLIW